MDTVKKLTTEQLQPGEEPFERPKTPTESFESSHMKIISEMQQKRDSIP